MSNQRTISYYPPNSEIELKVLFAEGSVWLTKKQILDLIKPSINPLEFVTLNETDIKLIKVSRYIEKRYESNYCFGLENTKFFELDDFRWFVTVKDRQRYYNVDAVLAIAYELDFKVAKHYRKWAEKQAKETQVDDSYHPVMNLYIKQLALNSFITYLSLILLLIITDSVNPLSLVSITAILFLGIVSSYVTITKHGIENGYKRNT